MATVRDTTYDLLRALGLTTVFGNPGSTEEPFLQDFPADFRYVHALHEASAVGMADGYAQATGRPAHVNLHTAPGTGNGMGNLVTAWHNRTPLIVTAGQQTREMLLIEPRLASRRATELPQPYVKWSLRAGPGAGHPGGADAGVRDGRAAPGGAGLPLPADGRLGAAGRPSAAGAGVATRFAPDPVRLRDFAAVLAASRYPVLVLGAAVDRADAWPAAVALAERLAAPVWSAPAPERAVFPEDHPHFRGVLPYAIGPLAQALRGHDTVLVVGAPVFRYYPHVPGDYLPDGTRLLHVTDDPDEAARAPVGDSLLGDAGLALAALLDLLPAADRPAPAARPTPPPPAQVEPAERGRPLRRAGPALAGRRRTGAGVPVQPVGAAPPAADHPTRVVLHHGQRRARVRVAGGGRHRVGASGTPGAAGRWWR